MEEITKVEGVEILGKIVRHGNSDTNRVLISVLSIEIEKFSISFSLNERGKLKVNNFLALEYFVPPKVCRELPWDAPVFAIVENLVTGEIGMIIQNPEDGTVRVNYDGNRGMEKTDISDLRFLNPVVLPSCKNCGYGLWGERCLFFDLDEQGEPVCHRYTRKRMEKLFNNNSVAKRFPLESFPDCQLSEKQIQPQAISLATP